jgi:hypothetical protein
MAVDAEGINRSMPCWQRGTERATATPMLEHALAGAAKKISIAEFHDAEIMVGW